MSDHPEVEIRSRAELRAWLARHHAEAGTCWLIFFKKHTDHYLQMGEIVSELLCWGWVDSVTRSVDADRSSIRIWPRSPASAWSAVNKAKVAAARANGMWDFLDDVERLEVPEDLARALGAQLAIWETWPRSVKRGTLEWIKTAKTAATREKRIADVVGSARDGLRPSPFRR